MKKLTNKQIILNKTKRVIATYLLLRDTDMTIGQLAKKFRVNPRSTQRDLKLLREAGAPVELGNWGYFVRLRGAR